MPEGDTIHKVAAALRPALVSAVPQRVAISGRAIPSLRRRIEAVRALGKHLLVVLEGGEAVRVHLGMHGSWHRYRKGSTWQKPTSQASLEVALEETVFVCFNAKEVECLDSARLGGHPVLGNLGPDLLGPNEIDFTQVVRRLRLDAAPGSPLADGLLNQRVASGIGNVYKSELCFLFSVHPATRIDQVPDDLIVDLYREAQRLLKLNLGPSRRRTTGGAVASDLWVYGRSGRPCLRCAEPVRFRRFGRHWRDTYWCPSCQSTASGEEI